MYSKELEEKKNDLITRAEEVLNTAKAETRELTDAEAQELAEIRDNVRRIIETLKIKGEFDKMENKEEPCIRCGSCVLSCPVHLEPVQIMNAVKTLDKERIKMLNPLKCIECGICSYTCTSKIPVTDYIRKAKLMAKL